jgi:hypothetical protein
MTENKGVLLMFYKASYGTLWDKLIAKLDGSPYSHVEIVLRWEQVSDLSHYLGTTTTISTIGCRADTGQVTTSLYSEFQSLDFILLPEASEEIYAHLDRNYSFLKLLRTKFNWWKLFPKHTDVCSTWVARVLGLIEPDKWGVKDLYRYAETRGIKVIPLKR